MHNINWIEWFGYFSSVIVAISLMMTSPIKLRWFNLAGSICFTFYGFIIEAYPVAIINVVLVVINIYHLYKLYNEPTRI